MIVKKISKEKLDKVSKCACNYGIIKCPGCILIFNNGNKIPLLSQVICAGCNGTGIRTCGKCGGL